MMQGMYQLLDKLAELAIDAFAYVFFVSMLIIFALLPWAIAGMLWMSKRAQIN